MKKQNLVFAAVIAGVVAAAGTMIAVISKVKERKERIECEKDAAKVEPIKDTDNSEDDEEIEFTLSDDEDVVADGDVVVMDTSEEDDPVIDNTLSDTETTEKTESDADDSDSEAE